MNVALYLPADHGLSRGLAARGVYRHRPGLVREWIVVCLLWISLATAASAQRAGRVDPSFGASIGLAGHVKAVAVQPDNKLLVVGTFKRGIVRLNANGSQDPSFDTGAGIHEEYDFVDQVILQADGKILVAGAFGTFAGAVRVGIARLNANGSLDTGFDPGASREFGGAIRVGLQPDGKILIVALLNLGDGKRHRHLIRLNPDGSRDPGFDVALHLGDDYSPLALAVEPDGGILVGGTFAAINGTARDGVARFYADGTLDAGFAPNLGRHPYVTTLLVQPDGKILVGGLTFIFGKGMQRDGLVRLNADGTLDASLEVAAELTFLGVNAAVLQPDGKILVGGDYSLADSSSGYGVFRFNTDGTLDAGFGPTKSTDEAVATLGLRADGSVVVGGEFHAIDGSTRNSLGLLHADGSLDGAFQPDVVPGLNAAVTKATVQPDGKIVVSGYFSTIGGVKRPLIARLNADGSLDPGFDPGTGPNYRAEKLIVQPDGKMLIGGYFSTVNGVDRQSFARLNADGSLDAGFEPGGDNPTITVVAFALQADGKILAVTENFLVGASENGYVVHYRLVRFNADGSADPGLNVGLHTNEGEIADMAVQPDGKILVIGSFSEIGGAVRQSIARLNADGTLDPSFDADDGTERFISEMILQPDGKILLCGGGPRGIARLNADGSPDAGFTPRLHRSTVPPIGGHFYVNTMALQPDGKVVVYGDDTTANGRSHQEIVRLQVNGDLDPGFVLHPAPNDAVNTLTVQPDGKILAGGNFNEIGGVVHNYFARLNADGSPDAGFVAGEGVPQIAALALQPDDGRVLAGGSFADVNGVPISALARLETDGRVDASFAPGFAPGDAVQALALQPDDGDVLVAIIEADATAARAAAIRSPHAQTKITNHIHRCSKTNGQIDAGFTTATDGDTRAVLGLPGKLTLIAGSFAQVNGQACGHLARLLADGSVDTRFVGTTDATVRALSKPATADGGIVIAGDFTRVDGQSRNRVARLFPDGSLDARFDPGLGADGIVNAVREVGSGKVLIGGNFTHVNGVARGGLARLNADGSLDTGFSPAPAALAVRNRARHSQGRFFDDDDGSDAPTILSLDVQPSDGKVVVAGNFDQFGTITRHRVARFNEDGGVDLDFKPGAGPNTAVAALQVQPDGRTLLGGGFSSVDGLERRGVARLLGDRDVPVAPQ